MPAPTHATGLTGNTRYRSSWFDKLVLQVEERVHRGHAGRVQPGTVSPVEMQWRDATVSDLRYVQYLEHKQRAAETGRPPPPPPDRLANGSHVASIPWPREEKGGHNTPKPGVTAPPPPPMHPKIWRPPPREVGPDDGPPPPKKGA